MSQDERSLEGVDYRRWLWRVVSWDTLLPALIVLIPTVIEALFPKSPDLIVMLAALLPMITFLIRFRAGKRQIAMNRCSLLVRRFQFFVFCIGIVALIFVDCLLIASQAMPAGALFADASDWMNWAILIGIYFGSMTVAMYPGRALSPDPKRA